MTDKSILLCSINAIDEYGGGGIYLRTLFHELVSQTQRLDVLCKKGTNAYTNPAGAINYFKKSWVADLVSRLLFSPCFLMFYCVSIVRQARLHKYDQVVLHNSRSGLLAVMLRYCTSAKIRVCFDNVEQKLASGDTVSSGARWAVARVDQLLCRFAEYCALKYAHEVSFITQADADFFCLSYPSLLHSFTLVPVKLPRKNTVFLEKNLAARPKVLFTASFAFYPNRLSAKSVHEFAEKHKEFDFILAGSFLNTLELPKLDNLYLVSDPTNDEMRNLFLTAHIYIAPVDVGSGMKTKLAEAMSYGLCAVVTQHAVIGYEKVVDDEFLKVVKHSGLMMSALLDWMTFFKQDINHYKSASALSYKKFMQHFSYRNMLRERL